MLTVKKFKKIEAKILRGWRSLGQVIIILLMIATTPISLPFLIIISLYSLRVLAKSEKHFRRASAYLEASKKIMDGEEWKNGTDESLTREISLIKRLHENYDKEIAIAKSLTEKA